MTNLINDFLSQPLWLSIPLVMVYLALLAYFLYILWHYRRNTLSAVVLTAALLVGQKAAADTPITHGGQNYTLFDSEGYYTATAGSESPSAYTYEYLVDNVIVPYWASQPFQYTYWLTDEDIAFDTKFIEFYSADPIVAKGYRLRTSINTKDHPNRRPKAWTLKGKKHAGDEWTTLATETNAQLPAEAEVTADYWLTSNTKTYQYFRFEVTAIQGPEKILVSSKISYTRYRMELSELQIIGNKDNINTDLDYATIEGLKHYYSWTGSDITPIFTVKDMSGNALAEGTHYTVSYSPATIKDVGTYTLTITGTGSYTGQQTASFKVYQALAGNGTETDPYIIADANDWYVFGKYIYENWNNTEGKYYKLADDFDNSNEPITEMIATTKKDANDPTKLIRTPFCGTLDGNGRTLHIDLKADSEDGCAPFRYLEGATIKNLTVAGSVATSSKFGASIAVNNLNHVGYINGTEIIDCCSRVTIVSSINGDGTNGGFVAVNQTGGKLAFTRCAFLGRMLGNTAHSNGGFVGWNDNGSNLIFIQCVFDPVWVSMSNTGSKTFSRYNTNAPSLGLQSYFTYAGWGKDQGTQAVALTTAPANLGDVVSAEGTMTLYQNALLCNGKYYVTNLSLYDNASNATLLRDTDGKQLNVTLSGRTLFKDGNWNTLCLPFDLKNDGFYDLIGNGTLMELDIERTYDANGNDDVNGSYKTGFDPATGTLSLYFKDATEIKAGTPYIIKWPKPSGYDDHESDYDISNREFQDVIINNSDETLIRQTVESEDEHVQFIGTFSPVTLDGGDKSNLFLGADNTLHWPSADRSIGSFRAYFHVDGGNVSAIKLHFGDNENTTAINEHDCNATLSERESHKSHELSGVWFDLQGRRLDAKPTAKGVYIYGRHTVVIK